jgi:hypothetical protein
VGKFTKPGGTGTGCHSGVYFALILVITLLTAGCSLMQPGDTSSPTAAPAETVTPQKAPNPALTIQPNQTQPVIQPNATQPATQLKNPPNAPQPVNQLNVTQPVIAIKNITITRPKYKNIFPEKEMPDVVVNDVKGFSNPRTADTINRYLRWESVRAHTNNSESVRIMNMVMHIDFALNTTPALKEDLMLYGRVSGDQNLQILNTSRYAEDGYFSCSYDPSVIYQSLSKTERDREGYVTMLVIRQKPGAHVLYTNETTREIILPRSMAWELAGEDRIRRGAFSVDSVPRYKDVEIENVRLLYMNQSSEIP